jgi:pimeloyl-ACP methyl ester carboxylesterase
VLLVAGERDAKFVSIAREMLRSLRHGAPDAVPGAPGAADRAPGAVRGAPYAVRGSLRVVPGAGHDVHLEAPAAFLDVVRDFLLEGGLACRSSG